MTMQRLGSFNKVWKTCPTQHVSLARITALLKAFMGIEEESASAPNKAAVERLMNAPEIEE